MGQHLARYVFVNYTGHLSGNEFKLLTGMCWAALDTPNGKGQPAGLCYVGQDTMLAWIGRDPEDLRAKGGSAYSNASTNLMRVLAGLVNKGFVERVGGRAGGRTRQTYRLTFTQAVDNSQTVGGQNSHPVGGQNSHPLPESGGVKQPPTGWPKQPPLGSTKEGGELQEKKTGDMGQLPALPQTARARVGSKAAKEERGVCGAHPAMSLPCLACRATEKRVRTA